MTSRPCIVVHEDHNRHLETSMAPGSTADRIDDAFFLLDADSRLEDAALDEILRESDAWMADIASHSTSSSNAPAQILPCNMDVDRSDHESEDDIEELDVLHKEQRYLEAEYEFLQCQRETKRTRVHRDRVSSPATTTEENELLSKLIQQQQVTLENVQAMLADAPINDVRMALMSPLESYIHLGRDFSERRQTILRLRHEKLAVARQFVEHKFKGLDLEVPHHYTDSFERFGKLYEIDFKVFKVNSTSVYDVVDRLYEHVILGNDQELSRVLERSTIRESYDSIHRNFVHQRCISSLQWAYPLTGARPIVESNAVFFTGFEGRDLAVMVMDYVDRDDLYPYDSRNRIRQDPSTGLVIQAHVDKDGNKCVIMKRFLLVKHHLYVPQIAPRAKEVLRSQMPLFTQKMIEFVEKELAPPEMNRTHTSVKYI